MVVVMGVGKIKHATACRGYFFSKIHSYRTLECWQNHCVKFSAHTFCHF